MKIIAINPEAIIMKVTLLLFLMITLVSCNKTYNREDTTPKAEEAVSLVHKSWHVTEGLDFDPVSLPFCSMDRVRKLKIGDGLDSVHATVGHAAVPFYHQKDFSILHTSDSSDSDYYWEVALQHEEGKLITDISFKKISIDLSL